MTSYNCTYDIVNHEPTNAEHRSGDAQLTKTIKHFLSGVATYGITTTN